MLLRSLSKHVKDQNWFAVGIDFCIVVIGILIAFQITNWNEGRALDALERDLLRELKLEIQGDIKTAEELSDHYENVHAAAKRSIAFMDGGGEVGPDCGQVCWTVLADFFHASQWFPASIKRSAFDDMRRQGLPRSRKIVSATETYRAQNNNNVIVLSDLPSYREVVRSTMPIAIHEAYWSACWSLKDGVETIHYNDCQSNIPNDMAASAVEMIIQHPDIRPTLTFWFSEITPTASGLENQIEAAHRAIATIDEELGQR